MRPDDFPLAVILAPVLLSLFSILGLVVSDLRQWRPGRFICKPLAAAAFLWLALALGAADSSYGMWLLFGLLFCMTGDLFLMPASDTWFTAGLIAFLCGHLLFATAFLQLPLNVVGLTLGTPAALALMLLAGLWLKPHLSAQMQVPVMSYIVVITLMLMCASLTLGHLAAPLIITGAWGFAISDLAVARQQFVQPSHLYKAWGTPLYFSSQMLLAASVALA